MIVYADASALVKRYVLEEGSDVANDHLLKADAVACSRIGFVEVYRAIVLSGVERPEETGQAFASDWMSLTVIEVHDRLVRRAAALAPSLGLRSLDAIHLASAEALSGSEMLVMTWDRRLWAACGVLGLPVLPALSP